jgi:thymidylate synthase ThyX
MGFECKILADSIGTTGVRLTTFQLRYPRIVLAEFNTHRMFSRNTSSSRAKPTAKILEEVTNDPFVTAEWRYKKSGMQPGKLMKLEDRQVAQFHWNQARNEALRHARWMLTAGTSKEIVNRLLEPWMWVDQVVTATEWDNFFELRCHEDAQLEIRTIALMMREALSKGNPQHKKAGEWHLPYLDDNAVGFAVGCSQDAIDFMNNLVKVCVARCARVSYTPFDAEVGDPYEDKKLYFKLLKSRHMSPFEHVAKFDGYGWYANFNGWKSHRYLIGE